MSQINRLEYIGSKYKLIPWLQECIFQATGWTSFKEKTVADLFAGTGVISWHFRQEGAIVISNDAELYSSTIAHAFTCSSYTEKMRTIMNKLNTDLYEGKRFSGFITKNYSPFETCERKFFTVDNAQRIDYVREELVKLEKGLDEDERKFLMASLLLGADYVSNTPAVYGCFLKNFKKKAENSMFLKFPHQSSTPPEPGSGCFNTDVLHPDLLNELEADLVYLDPPYNERQYSKNYFPLNMIVDVPADVTIKGVTGIPSNCFDSDFCRSKKVGSAFETLVNALKAKWIAISYNSESLIKKDDMISLLSKYGTVQLFECDYKRFKSFEYNESGGVKEYLFVLKKD